MQYHEIIGYKKNCLVRAALESIAYYPFHLHKDDFEIICVLNGQITISDSALTHSLSYGDVYIFNPNDPHKIVSEDKSNLILTIQFNRDYWSRNFSQLTDAYFICEVLMPLKLNICGFSWPVSICSIMMTAAQTTL